MPAGRVRCLCQTKASPRTDLPTGKLFMSRRGYQNRTRDALGQNAQWLSLKAEGTWKDNGVALRLPAIAIGAETSQMIPGSLDDGEPLRLRERISALRTQVRRCFWLWIAW